MFSENFFQVFIQALLSTAAFPKDSVSWLFGWLSGSVGWPHARHRRKIFWTLGLKIPGKCIFLGFFIKFQKIMGSFEEKLTKKIHTTFLYACLKASKLKSKNNRWIERKSFKGASKTKKKKNTWRNWFS